jgi:hypothetical protein
VNILPIANIIVSFSKYKNHHSFHKSPKFHASITRHFSEKNLVLNHEKSLRWKERILAVEHMHRKN